MVLRNIYFTIYAWYDRGVPRVTFFFAAGGVMGSFIRLFLRFLFFVKSQFFGRGMELLNPFTVCTTTAVPFGGQTT